MAEIEAGTGNMRALKIYLVLAAVMGITLAAITARHSGSTSYYVKSLRQIQRAKEQWAADNVKNSNNVPTWNELLPYLSNDFTNFYWTNGFVVRPEGGIYVIGRVGDPARCLINGRTIYP